MGMDKKLEDVNIKFLAKFSKIGIMELTQKIADFCDYNSSGNDNVQNAVLQ